MPSGWDSIQEPNRAIASYIGEKAGSYPNGSKRMDETTLWILEIIAPAILLIVLIWLIMRRRSTGKTGRTEQATHELYQQEESRRREGTDTAEK